ncbi:MAG TPA: YkgJ family cysteine cluster protein [Polyangiaceae bacterium]|nr:YkgJ family cysteine cluster protein [Polyangiaceae bacterium]
MGPVRCLVWRPFGRDDLEAAARYARRGGGALVVGERGGSKAVLFRPGADGEPGLLVAWALKDLHAERFRAVGGRGPAAGLALAPIPANRRWVAATWLARDRAHAGPTRTLAIDCMTCAACCHDNAVLLEPDDLLRWKRARRLDLAAEGYVERRGRRQFLRLADSGACQHLRDKLCGIYPLRPFNCRAFPAGTEPCLFARFDRFGTAD